MESTELSPLANYGKKIFERENCSSCHVLRINESTSTMYSLDGIAGKYADSYLFSLLINPTDFVFNGYMPEYIDLLDQIDKADFRKTIDPNSNLASKEFEDIWMSVPYDIDSFSVAFLGEDIRNTELQAIVAYIQTIDPSPVQKKIDKKETKKSQKKFAKYSKAWDAQEKDNYKGLILKSNDKERIPEGKKIYISNCAVCHLENGEGAIGPNLTDDYWISGGEDLEILKSIIIGNPDKGMIPFIYELMPNEASDLLAYLKSIKGTNLPNAKPPQGTRDK